MISVVLPTYLEGENLEKILPKIHSKLSEIQHEILVVDTMTSMDDTPNICSKNDVRYVNRIGGNNYGDAIRTGIKLADGDYIVIMDADGSHDPGSIIDFYNAMQTGKYDLIIGSRYVKGGYTDNPWVLRFMSWVLNCTYRVIFGLKVKDISNSFRMYKKELVKSLVLECDNFDIVEEILIKLCMVNKPFVVKEIPISFNKRMAGESKRSLIRFIFSYIGTIKRLLSLKRTYKG